MGMKDRSGLRHHSACCCMKEWRYDSNSLTPNQAAIDAKKLRRVRAAAGAAAFVCASVTACPAAANHEHHFQELAEAIQG